MPVKASYNPELYFCHFLLIIFGGYFPLWFASFYQKRYGFEQSFFTHKHFLMLHSFPLFRCICHSDSSRKISSRVFLNACSHRVVPFGLRMALNYCCSSYKTIFINYTKYQVKTGLLNMF